MAFRPIAPLCSDERRILSQPSPDKPMIKRRRVAGGACTSCCQRKVKCDGARPSCHSCLQLRLECIYLIKPGETRYQSLQRANGELQSSLHDYQLLFKELQSGPEDAKASILAQLDSKSDLDDIVRKLKASDNDVSSPTQDKLRLPLGAEQDSSTATTHLETRTLQKDLREYTDLIAHLQSVADEDAIDAIRRLKTSSNISMLLASFKGSVSIRHRPSELRTSRAILSSTQSGIEFELSLLHKVVYPGLPPLNIASIDIDALLRDAPRRSLQLPDPETPALDDVLIGRKARISPFRDVKPNRPLSGPLHTPQFSDSRLKYLKLEYWTNIPIDNLFAAGAISLYLENDHPIFGFFDADLMLTDLVSQRVKFCSSFLVNSLLYLVCQSYACIDIRAISMSHAFFNETERLWHAERLTDLPTTVASMMLFGFGCTMSGKETISFQLFSDVRTMARRMGLFGVPPSSDTTQAFRQSSTDQRRERAHVAWGAYNWLSIRSVYFQEDPLLFPPNLPVPGGVITSKADTELDILAWPPHPLPDYMGQTFHYMCKFSAIVQEIHTVYHKGGYSLSTEKPPLAFTEGKYQKLLDWADSLPASFTPNESSPAHVLIFAGLYHGTIVHLFRPFTLHPHPPRLRSFVSPDTSPHTISTASLNQAKRIIFLYMSQFQPSLYSPIFSAVLMNLIGLLLNSGPDWHFYFLLCQKYLTRIYTRYPVFASVARAHLVMAMAKGTIRGAEANRLMGEIRRCGRHHEKVEEAITTCIVDFDLARTAPTEAQAQAMAEKFDELAVFDEFTRGEFDGVGGGGTT